MSKSELELVLWEQINECGLPVPQREKQFHPSRRWRADFLWRDKLIMVEVEGGTWNRRGKSRHTTPSGFEKDCYKYNAAAELGYRVFRYTSKMIYNNHAIEQLERLLSE